LVVVENNSFSGYKSYAHQQYKRSLSSIQKSVNNLSSIINKSNENLRQKRSYIEHDDYSESFKLIYPYQSIVLAQDVCIFFYLFFFYYKSFITLFKILFLVFINFKLLYI